MEHPESEKEITEDDLLAFIGGKASDAVVMRIAEERKIAGSFTDRWFKAMTEALQKPFEVNLRNLIE